MPPYEDCGEKPHFQLDNLTYRNKSLSRIGHAIEEIDQLLNSIDMDLQELSLKSLGIGVFLGKTKQYANKIDASAKQLKSYAQKLGDDDLKNCFTSIADWFNSNDYKTPRGKMFHGSHVHSIVKKKKTREVRLNHRYEPKLSNFALRFVDRTLINQ
jgi:hypothetical protein